MKGEADDGAETRERGAGIRLNYEHVHQEGEEVEKKKEWIVRD